MLALYQIRGIHRHGFPQRFGIAHQRKTAIVADIRPLVGIGCPGISQLKALGQLAILGRSGGPQAEGAIG